MEIHNITNDIKQIKRDIRFIKSVLISEEDEEGELSEWAKNELAKARTEPEDNYTNLDQLRKEIENEI